MSEAVLIPPPTTGGTSPTVTPNPVHWALQEDGVPQSKQELLARMRAQISLWTPSPTAIAADATERHKMTAIRRQVRTLIFLVDLFEECPSTNPVAAYQATLDLLARDQIENTFRQEVLHLVEALRTQAKFTAQTVYRLLVALLEQDERVILQLEPKVQTYARLLRSYGLSTTEDYVNACAVLVGPTPTQPSRSQTDTQRMHAIFVERVVPRLVVDNVNCQTLMRAALFSLIVGGTTRQFANCVAISSTLATSISEISVWTAPPIPGRTGIRPYEVFARPSDGTFGTGR